MSTRAHIEHRTRGRMRLRVPERRHDQGFFLSLKNALEELELVESVQINPRTAGVLIGFAEGAEEVVLEALAGLELIEMGELPAPAIPALTALLRETGHVNRRIREQTGDSADLNTLLFITLFGLALRQLLRGEIMAPAVPLFWYALEALRHGQGGGGES